ncbi:MAG: flagellar hook-basal body complex protein FliE [Candidatus Binataceae bacterium]
MSAIIATQGLAELSPVRPESAAPAAHNGFGQVLEQVNEILNCADQMAAGYAQGKVGLTDAVLASSQADTEFSTLIAVRNRALAAHQEIMNLQV